MNLPVVEQKGFKYFVINTSRGIGYANAKTIGGRRYYAKDYPVSVSPEPEYFTEPNDAEWLRMIK